MQFVGEDLNRLRQIERAKPIDRRDPDGALTAIKFFVGQARSLGPENDGRIAAANVKLISVAVKTDFWGHGKYLKDLGPIHRNKPIYMDFGKPMEVTGSGKAEHEKIIEFISSSLTNWGGKVKRK